MKRYTKRQRKDAIMICLCAASWDRACPNLIEVCDAMAFMVNRSKAVLLAEDALAYVYGRYDSLPMGPMEECRAADAEAAQLLIEGWTP
jgi:hypothetical protein